MNKSVFVPAQNKGREKSRFYALCKRRGGRPMPYGFMINGLEILAAGIRRATPTAQRYRFVFFSG
jgi:hypothetical protein